MVRYLIVLVFYSPTFHFHFILPRTCIFICYIITHSTIMSNLIQCEICQKWCFNKRSLLTHLGFCRQRHTESAGLDRYRDLSRYAIKNSLTRKHMPLSDNVHGPSRMMPPEVLHVFYAGLLWYIFTSMQLCIGSSKLRDEIDKMHVRVTQDVKCQSDRDLPRGSMRNGIIDDTKCQSEERQGNFFLPFWFVFLSRLENKSKRSQKSKLQVPSPAKACVCYYKLGST